MTVHHQMFRDQRVHIQYACKQSSLDSYTKTPVTMEAIKVPTIAKVIIAPKFEKNGFCKYRDNIF